MDGLERRRTLGATNRIRHGEVSRYLALGSRASRVPSLSSNSLIALSPPWALSLLLLPTSTPMTRRKASEMASLQMPAYMAIPPPNIMVFSWILVECCCTDAPTTEAHNQRLVSDPDSFGPRGERLGEWRKRERKGEEENLENLRPPSPLTAEFTWFTFGLPAGTKSRELLIGMGDPASNSNASCGFIMTTEDDNRWALKYPKIPPPASCVETITPIEMRSKASFPPFSPAVCVQIFRHLI